MCDEKLGMPQLNIYLVQLSMHLSLLALLSVGLALSLGGGYFQKWPIWGSSARKGTFFRLQVYKRVAISLLKVYERVGKSFISVFKKPNRANR